MAHPAASSTLFFGMLADILDDNLPDLFLDGNWVGLPVEHLRSCGHCCCHSCIANFLLPCVADAVAASWLLSMQSRVFWGWALDFLPDIHASVQEHVHPTHKTEEVLDVSAEADKYTVELMLELVEHLTQRWKVSACHGCFTRDAFPHSRQDDIMHTDFHTVRQQAS